MFSWRLVSLVRNSLFSAEWTIHQWDNRFWNRAVKRISTLSNLWSLQQELLIRHWHPKFLANWWKRYPFKPEISSCWSFAAISSTCSFQTWNVDSDLHPHKVDGAASTSSSTCCGERSKYRSNEDHQSSWHQGHFSSQPKQRAQTEPKFCSCLYCKLKTPSGKK